MDEREILAENLKLYRKEQRKNQFEFAEDCGLSDGIVSLIERKKTNVTLDTLQMLAANMGKSVSELFTGENDIAYCLIPTPICINDKEVITYGIGALKKDIMIDYVLDISDDYNKILSLVKLCNEEELDPIHLHDVAENALVD